LPPHLHREPTRHGKLVWYVRIDHHGPRIRIREEYDTPEFWAAYRAAIDGEPAPKKAGAKTGTLAWLISRYRDSVAWASLSQATKKQRENIFLHVIKSAGEEPFAKITRKTIAAARDRRKDTPFAANNFLKTMRGLFRWALESGFVDLDPTEGIKASIPRTKGFHPGARMKSCGSRNAGRLEPANASRLPSCFSAAFDGATPRNSAASMSAMA
jgi:hypothetical protein